MFDFLKPVWYVQISADLLSVRDVRSGATLAETPEIALRQSPRVEIVAMGAAARQAAANDVIIVNPFAHPRTPLGDFTLAEQLLRDFLRRMPANRWLRIQPLVIIHPLGDWAGGLTQIELRAFQELALGAGARRAMVRDGAPLSDQEIHSGHFF